MAALVILSLGGLWTLIWRQAWRWLGLGAMAAGVGVALAAPAPDILVARDAVTVAVRGSDGLLRLVRPAGDDYSAGEWLKRDGDGRDVRCGGRDARARRALRRLWLHRQGARRKHRSLRASTRWPRIAPAPRSW